MTTKRWPGVKIGMVAGNFDVIHPGYVKMFEDAKENACNVLIIALQGDPTIERPYKCKPVQTIKEREYILRSISYVDEVIHYNTEAELLEIVKKQNHDVRIVGSDYKDIDFTGKIHEKEIYYHDRSHEYSLTDLKKRITEQMLAQNKE
jgi:glycerol-3-phosphate cytidylyltransferase